MKISLHKAANIFYVSYQALLAAARIGRLKHERIKGKYFVFEKDVQSYLANRYSREKRKFSGKIIHDKENLSPYYASKLLNKDLNFIYYEMRKGRLPFIKENRWYVIKLNDVEKYKVWMKNECFRDHSNSARCGKKP